MVIVHVTQKHIDEGERWECSYCPVALALKERLSVPRVSVGDYIVVDRAGYRVPRSVERFIARFDDGKPVTPFAFKLEAQRA